MHNKITTLVQILLFLCLTLSLFGQDDDDTLYAGIMTTHPETEEEITIECRVSIPGSSIMIFDCDNTLYLFQINDSGYTAKSGFLDYDVILGTDEDKHIYLLTDANKWIFGVDTDNVLPPGYKPKNRKRQ